MRFLTPLTARLIAALLVALGLVVCLAWLGSLPAVTQILPNAAAMQFNTALMFVTAGVSLAALSYGKPSVARAGSVAVTLFTALTLSQYITGIDYGIDRLFLDAPLSPNTSHSGRMAPNTASAFIIAGISLYLLSSQRSPFLAAVLAALVAAIGIVSLAGYAFGLTTAYGWGQLTRMAIHTAAAFVLLGFGLFVISTLQMKIAALAELPWAGTVAGVLVASLSLLLWQAINSEHVRDQQRLMQQEAQAIAERLAERARNRLQAMDRMALRYALGAYGTPAEWQLDAQAYLRDMPAIDLILVEDESGRVLAQHARSAAAARLVSPSWSRRAGADTGHVLISAADGPWLVSTQRGAHGRLIRVFAHTDAAALAAAEMQRPDANPYRIMILASAEQGPPVDIAFGAIAEARMPPPAAAFKVRVQQRTNGSGRYFRMADLLLVGGLALALLLAQTISQYQKLQALHQQLVRTNAALQARTQALIASNESLEQFAYAASHDLKAPIRTMVSFTQLIGMQDEGATVESVRDLLQEVVKAGKGLNDLVDTLLEVSRAGRITPAAIKPVSMRSLVDNVLARLAATIKERGVRVELGELPVLETEPGLMTQVLQNLIANAIKFQPGERPYVGVFASRMEDGWLFSVVDHGPGIEPRYHEEIFRLFSRGDPHNVEGTGVGLAIVRRILNGLGGRIWVESTPGQGAAFKFYHPARPILQMS